MAPSTLIAHAAFFIDAAPTPDLGSLFEPGPLLALAAGIVAGFAAWAIAASCADPHRDRCLLRWASELVSGVLVSLTDFVPPIARIALGASLAWCGAIGAVATPNLLVHDATGDLLRVAAVALGVMLVLGVRSRACAALAIGVFGATAILAHAPVVVLERLDIVGLAVFVVLVGGRRLEPRMDDATLRALRRASTWLRVLVASGLVAVAITEKLANVPMTAQVLAEHPNVDLGILLGTTPTTTVLILGAAEIAFAVLVLLLPLPELVALAIGAPFVLSVGEFGLVEVPGHLPVWGAVLVLALLGAHPQTSDLLSVRPPWLRGRVRTPRAAREQLVGDRVPWATTPAPTPAAPPQAPRRIAVGGSSTAPATVPAAARIAHEERLPAAPPLAPQVAAWLAPTQQQPVAAPPRAADLPRFEWAPHPGAGACAR